MRLLQQPGACDCHSHVYGPFDRYPLAADRAFDSPEAPIEALEAVWQTLGIDRSVLIQSSTHGHDHRALLAALARSPATRRGVAVLQHHVADEVLTELNAAGVRAVRFNWVPHLLHNDPRSQEQRVADAAILLERIAPLGWHVVFHLDADNLDILKQLPLPTGMPLVIDHMARIDGASPALATQLDQLKRLLEDETLWIKLSGADRMRAACDDLEPAAHILQQLIAAAPGRCLWGLDWPHVNLSRTRTDASLVELLQHAAGDDATLHRVLVTNPEHLYGFEPIAA